MNVTTQIAIQLGVWLIGMGIDYLLTGHALLGGILGATSGFFIVLFIKLTPKHK